MIRALLIVSFVFTMLFFILLLPLSIKAAYQYIHDREYLRHTGDGYAVLFSLTFVTFMLLFVLFTRLKKTT